MKKSLIFKILYLFLVLIVVAGASVFATNTYLASQISYGSSNVEDALNGLFTLQGNDENYSTEERIVGKWIDEKNIYRKIIEKKVPIHGNTDLYPLDTLTDNIETTTSLKVFARYNNQLTSYADMSQYTNSNGFFQAYWIADNTLYLRNYNNSFDNANCLIIIEYTKTNN